jgi:hypothetical protein
VTDIKKLALLHFHSMMRGTLFTQHGSYFPLLH